MDMKIGDPRFLIDGPEDAISKHPDMAWKALKTQNDEIVFLRAQLAKAESDLTTLNSQYDELNLRAIRLQAVVELVEEGLNKSHPAMIKALRALKEEKQVPPG